MASSVSAKTALAWIVGLFVLIVSVNCDASEKSQAKSFPGHWPENYCKISNVVFSTGDQTLHLNSDLSELDKCYKVKDIWKFESRSAAPQEMNDIVCDQVFKRGHFFTTYYFHGSNYFHLHYDTLLPLFMALKQESKSMANIKEMALLPGVEAEREKGIDWDTDAFMDGNSYWMQMMMMMSRSRRFLPLDRRLAGINKTICFEEAYFGTPKINFTDASLLQSFSTFVKKSLGVKRYDLESKAKPKIGLIHRDGRRRILNEDQLIKSVNSFADVEIIDFSKMSIKEQIQSVQKYHVLIGMNGAGLINALYLPETSVAVQLVPYKAEVNVAEFANLLKARGPYLEWHNTHVDKNLSAPEDVFRNGSDTIVDIKEFVEVIRRALEVQKDYVRH